MIIKFHSVLGKFIDGVGWFCALLLVLMLCNVFFDVVMRYLFNDVSIGMQELEWHLFSTMFMLGIGYTLKQDEHVRVDIFYDQLKKRTQAIINIIGTLIFLFPFCILVVYYATGYVVEAYELGEGSGDPGGLPHRWIIKSMIPLSFVFLMLSGVHFILTQIISLTTSEDSHQINRPL